MAVNKKSSKKDELHNLLVKAITSNEYYPGEHLVEAELMDKYGYSRSTIRETLLQLSSEGYVVRYPNKGFKVMKVTQEEINHIKAILKTLEAEACYQAALNATLEDIDDLRNILESCYQSLDNADVSMTAETMNNFVYKLAEYSHNPYIYNDIKEYYTLFHNLFNYPETLHWEKIHYEISRNTADVYTNIIKAIEDRDPKKAFNLMYSLHLDFYS